MLYAARIFEVVEVEWLIEHRSVLKETLAGWQIGNEVENASKRV